MEIYKSAIIFFYDEKGRILLQERKGASKFGEEWAIFGGRCENQENFDEAIKREMQEELEHNLTDHKFIQSYSGILKSHDGIIRKFERGIFIAPLGDKLPKFKLHEGSGMKLFSIAEARKLKMMSHDGPALDIAEKAINDHVLRRNDHAQDDHVNIL